jgi:uncharacterized coiled-coil protein SlyX
MADWLQTTLAVIGVVSGIVSLLYVGISIGQFKGVVDALKTTVATLETSLCDYARRDVVERLEARMHEDRSKNEEQHKTFYAVENTVIKLQVTMESMQAQVSRIEAGVDKLLERGNV